MKKPVRTFVVAAAAAVSALSITVPVAAAVPSADRKPPTLAESPKVLLSAAEVKSTLALKTPMEAAGKPTVTVMRGYGYSGQQNYSPLGAKWTATEKKYSGPYQLVDVAVTVGETVDQTAYSYKKIRDAAKINANLVPTNTDSKLVMFKGSTGRTSDKRTASTYVFKSGILSEGECITYTSTVTYKDLIACSTKVAEAQWAKANKVVK